MIESSSVHPLTRELDEKVDSVLDQLPTLDDVLYRHSQPPVCLYNYYIVLRDRLQLETWLDFWLDIAQADILYKRYIKYKKRPSKMQLKKPSIASSLFSSESPRHDILTHMLLLQPRTSLANTITTTGSNKRPPPTQTEMHETIERIYLRYIVPSAEKELVQLPFQIKQQIHQFFNSETPNEKDNPAVYAESKAYVHQVLESTFPLFLRYKVFMNLTLPQQIGRLALGLVCLLVGFSLEFSLIFLDVRPWQNRLWGLLPIALGVFCTVTSVSGIDPVWVLVFNLSETVPFQFNQIIQYKVKKILRKRSLIVSCIIFLVTLIFMIFFCAVAGRRL